MRARRKPLVEERRAASLPGGRHRAQAPHQWKVRASLAPRAFEEVARLKAENAALREEIARLTSSLSKDEAK